MLFSWKLLDVFFYGQSIACLKFEHTGKRVEWYFSLNQYYMSVFTATEFNQPIYSGEGLILEGREHNVPLSALFDNIQSLIVIAAPACVCKQPWPKYSSSSTEQLHLFDRHVQQYNTHKPFLITSVIILLEADILPKCIIIALAFPSPHYNTKKHPTK